MRKRLVIEMGIGTDLHGADMTKAAVRAARDAISRSCICGIIEIFERNTFEGIYVDIHVAVPSPDEVDKEAVMAVLPIGEKTINVVEGGMRVPGIELPNFGPGSSDIVMACVSITVFVDMDE